MSNLVYYSSFDTAANQFLIERGALHIHKGLVSWSTAAVRTSIRSAFSDTVHAGIRVANLGNASVRYGIALYRNDDALL